jgi:hypothetical protein
MEDAIETLIKAKSLLRGTVCLRVDENDSSR